MIALLIGGTVVFCIGILTVVFGIPIKEFSFGSTMILAGAIVACTGLILVGLYAVGRELRNLTRRLEAGLPVAAPVLPVALPREPAAEIEAVPPVIRPARTQPELPPAPRPLPPRPAREDTLFTRDQPSDGPRDEDDFGARDTRDHDRPSEPPAWDEHPVARSRAPAPGSEQFDSQPPEPAPRQRRNIMFSSHRRDKNLPSREDSPDEAVQRPEIESRPPSDRETGASDPFDRAWPQSGRTRQHDTRQEPSAPPNGRTPSAADEAPEPARERFQPPRRSDASSVTIVKSGVVDSMAYSLYSDGSIEAQMPEGMVRFASIDELRAHLDQRN